MFQDSLNLQALIFRLASRLAVVFLSLTVVAEPLRIVVTVPAIHSWAANVVGEAAEVETLLPADVGPHDFQFRPSDMRKLAKADLILINGLGVDDWLTRTIANGGGKPGHRVITVSDGVATQLIYHLPQLTIDAGKSSAHAHGHDSKADKDPPNPHIWLDPIIAQQCVSNILAALLVADPSNAEGYKSRAAAYLRELTDLDRSIRSSLMEVKNRRIVTFHNAFPYFCRRYDLTLIGVIEQVPSVDPSPKYLAGLLAAIRKNSVDVLFTEPQFNPRLAKRIAGDLKIQMAELDVLETGKSSKAFYVEGMRRNLAALKAALR